MLSYLILNSILLFKCIQFKCIASDLPKTARVVLIFNISYRDAAAVLNCYLEEEGIITSDDTSSDIDLNFVRRWKSKVYKEHIPSKLDGLYLDGKLDKTCDVKFRRETTLH